MRQRLFNKYFITATIIILFSLGVMMMIMTFVYNDYLADMKYETLNKTSSNIAKLIEENVETSESFSDNSELKSALKVTLNQISDIDSTDVFIADNTGKIIISGSEDTVLNIPLEFFAKSKTQGMETLGIYSKLHYYTYQKIYSDSKDVLGYVVVTAPFTEIKALMTRVAKLYLLSAIIPIVAMFFALYGITYRMTKPLKLMSDAAKAMSKGDFSKRIPVTSDDEIGELAVSFNQMTNSLSRLEEMRKGFVADISHEFKTPLTTIGGFIDGITDGTIEPEKQGYYLNIVSGEVKRLTRMVQSMLSLARIESSDFVLKYET
ncbi:MAG: HAMP domain-containing protein, partial [Clostridia bacterium]|nr:HAMP domain-containing protein [Clostridia bacterium]